MPIPELSRRRNNFFTLLLGILKRLLAHTLVWIVSRLSGIPSSPRYAYCQRAVRFAKPSTATRRLLLGAIKRASEQPQSYVARTDSLGWEKPRTGNFFISGLIII